MALISKGSINDFSVTAKSDSQLEMLDLKQKVRVEQLRQTGVSIRNVAELSQVTRIAPQDVFEFLTSPEERGLGLKSVELARGFDGFIRNLFRPDNEVYFIAWVWDLSGQPVYQYPGEGVDPESMIFKLKTGDVREFIGDGINLFPKRKVRGGIAVRIQIWESDADARSFGKVITEVADSIQKSELNSLLSLISLAGAPLATVTLVKEAALELAKVIGTILKANSNDYVDLFEGYYAADQLWEPGFDNYTGNSAVLSLKKY